MSIKDIDLSTRELMLRVNKRLMAAAVASAIASAAMAAAMVVILPLKEMVPYVVEVDAKSGEAWVPNQNAAQRYEPTEEVKRFFVKRWIVDAFTINQYTTVKENDPRARKMLRGRNVLAAYDEQMAKDEKFSLMAKYPGMTRDVAIESITPVAGTPNAMVASVALTTRISGEAKVDRRLVTVYFDFFPIRDKSDVDVSPIGLFITDFKVSDA